MIESNRKILNRQRLFLFLGAGSSIALIAALIASGSGPDGGDRAEDLKRSLDLEGVVTKPTLEENWLSRNELRLEEMERELERLKAVEEKNAGLADDLAAERAEKDALLKDARRTLEIYERRIKELESRATADPRPALQQGPPAGGVPFRRAGKVTGSGPSAAIPAEPARTIEILNFDGERSGDDFPASFDAENYLPPNAYVRARVLVGADATVGANAQANPKPVEFRIVGPAYSASRDGRRLATDVEGCIVNGAAVGELSTEKVYVKLQKMTCPDGANRVVVANVQGYLAYKGKAGVRGRVVSREGDLVMQALLAGVAGGFGRGFSANANSKFRTIGIGSTDQTLSGEEILTGGLGQGVATAADTVSDYLIERAEQYQPVIEMPTGIEVELVFLNGVHIRRGARP